MTASARKRHVSAKSLSPSDHGPRTRKSQESRKSKYNLFALGTFVIAIIIVAIVFFGNRLARQDPLTNTKKETYTGNEKEKTSSKKTSKHSIPLNVINSYDEKIIEELEKANKVLQKGRPQDSVRKFEDLISKYPKSPFARYGKAQALDKYADELRSNDVLQSCINAYDQVPDAPNCPPELAKLALLRMAERLGFFGKRSQALQAIKRLVAIVPNDIAVLQQLGVQHLLTGGNYGARDAFEKVLKLDPKNGFALAHMGFVLKSLQKLEECIPYFEEGLRSGDKSADDPRFYFHLGDAYNRIGKPTEAWRVYEEGARKGHFMSAWQRSLYNADTPLKAQPWWDPEESGYLKAIRKLEANWKTIRDEGLAVLDLKSGGFLPEEENLRETGDWLQYTLYHQGRKSFANCRRTPKTCALMDTLPEAVGCNRGQIKYSVMHPGTHVWPHCGPTNCRLRSHLGLVIPKGVAIRCGKDVKTWKEGKVIIIDDSFDHEVWHNGTSFRLIFIVDFWHPGLSQRQREQLTPI